MRLDIHVHTSPGSRCSQMTVKAYFHDATGLGLDTLCITNHGETGDYEAMLALVPDGLHVIPGVEISSPEGDFLVFSTDMLFLSSLEPVQSLPDRGSRPPETAVVWAHPFAGNPGGAGVAGGYIKEITAGVDGIEVFNGNWPDEQASALARSIAAEYGIAELGGSDTHRLEQIMRCYTVFDAEIKNAAELVAAILGKKTHAVKA
ncbi:MAG: PHP domain-containing protein [Actinobacteria bacterium]|nr:PHP domain-containing protein [Actinomycetota bacterium]